jgi:hypothetical protein
MLFCNLVISGVQFEVSDQETSTSDFQYDEESKTMRVQLSALDGGNRRTRLVTFTCNKCGESVPL